jgi:hypothetical protein
MTARDMTPMAVAIRLWEAAAATCTDAPDAPVVVDAVLVRVEAGLRRWIGAEGYAALLSRAVDQVLTAHPALAGIAELGTRAVESGTIVPDDDEARRHAILALLCTMMHHLGGIIGDNMAVRLFEQTISPSQRGIAGVELNETPT